MLARYIELQEAFDEFNIEPFLLNGLKGVADGLANAQMLQAVLTKYGNEANKPFDIICLIHLLYQNLGASVEAIPYEFRDMFEKELSQIYGTTQRGSTKSWIVRSACAHMRSFDQLCMTHNKALEQQLLKEAGMAEKSCLAVLSNLATRTRRTLPQTLKSQIEKLVDPQELDKCLVSSNWKLPKVVASDSVNLSSLLGNCLSILDAASQAILQAKSFEGSLPSQALAILTRQLMGENARRMLENDNAVLAPLSLTPQDLGRVITLKVVRNRRAHECHIYEQLDGNPHGMLEEFAGLVRLRAFFDRQFEVAQKLLGSKVTQKAEGKESKAVDRETSSSPAPEATVVVSGGENAKSKPKKKKDKVGTEKRRKFREKLLTHLKEAEGLFRADYQGDNSAQYLQNIIYKCQLADGDRNKIAWDEQSLFDLMGLLLNPMALEGRKKSVPNRKKDYEICKFILDNLHLFSNKSIAEFIKIPFKLEKTRQINPGIWHYGYASLVLTRNIAIKVKPEEALPCIYPDLLTYSICHADILTAEFLLERGADPNITFNFFPEQRMSALEYCVRFMNKSTGEPDGDFVSLLLNHGARVGKLHGEPLAVAAYKRGLPIGTVKLIVENTKDAHRNYLSNPSQVDDSEITKGKHNKTERKQDADKLTGIDLANAAIKHLNSAKMLTTMLMHIGLCDRFFSHENESLYLVMSLIKSILKRKGVNAAYDIVHKTQYSEKHEKATAHGAMKLKHSGHSLTILWGIKGLNKVLRVHENIDGVLTAFKDNRGCPLHLAVLGGGSNVLEYLFSTSLRDVCKELQMRPKISDMSTACDPVEFAEAIGEEQVAAVIRLFDVLSGERGLLRGNLNGVLYSRLVIDYAFGLLELAASSSLARKAHELPERAIMVPIPKSGEMTEEYMRSYLKTQGISLPEGVSLQQFGTVMNNGSFVRTAGGSQLEGKGQSSGRGSSRGA